MKAIFIDAVNRTVTEIQIENDLQTVYEKIGCRLIQMLDIGEKHVLCIDEDFRFYRKSSANLPIGGDHGVRMDSGEHRATHQFSLPTM